MVHGIIDRTWFIAMVGMLATSMLTGCYYDNEEELYPQSGLQNCDTTNLTYNGRIQVLINSRCATAGCHDGRSGLPSYTNYASVKAIADNGSLEDRALIRKDMPPTGPLSPCEQEQLRLWLLRGAPENP